VSTVHKYLKRAEAAGVKWPLPEDWDEARVEAALFPEAAASGPPPTAARTPPDFATIHKELQSDKHVTLQLLWDEYKQANPDGYRHSRYCELYQLAMPQCRDDPTLRHLHGVFHLGFIARLARTRGHDAEAAMHREVVVGRIQIRIVAVRLGHTGLAVIRNSQLRNAATYPAQESEPTNSGCAKKRRLSAQWNKGTPGISIHF